jgi:Fic family protein
MSKEYKRFMLESNRIEGEDRVNPGDIKAVEFIIDSSSLCVGCILQVHQILGEYLNQHWVGKFRTCPVFVGKHNPPPYQDLEVIMNDYVLDLDKMDSWSAHNEFEYIHPFQDLNGRVGRLIWLYKALKEGYNFKIPFLQAYYYQTLAKGEEE